MDRRNFLGTLVGGVATAAAVRTWPFRVYSFSSQLSIVESVEAEIRRAMEEFRRELDRRMYADGIPGMMPGLAGVAYCHETDMGAWMGLKRSAYPERNNRYSKDLKIVLDKP